GSGPPKVPRLPARASRGGGLMAAATATAAPAAVAPRRLRPLIAATAVSGAGDGMFAAAAGLLAVAITRNPVTVALVEAVRFGARIVFQTPRRGVRRPVAAGPGHDRRRSGPGRRRCRPGRPRGRPCGHGGRAAVRRRRGDRPLVPVRPG